VLFIAFIASSAPNFDFYAFMGEPRTIATAGNYIYVTNEIGLHILDVQDPESPILVGFYYTMGFASDIAVAGGYIYVADYKGGLVVLRFHPSNESRMQ